MDDTIVVFWVALVVEVTLGTLALLGAIVVREGGGRGIPRMLGVAGSFSRHLGPSMSLRVLIILEKYLQLSHLQISHLFFFGTTETKKY